MANRARVIEQYPTQVPGVVQDSEDPAGSPLWRVGVGIVLGRDHFFAIQQIGDLTKTHAASAEFEGSPDECGFRIVDDGLNPDCLWTGKTDASVAYNLLE